MGVVITDGVSFFNLNGGDSPSHHAITDPDIAEAMLFRNPNGAGDKLSLLERISLRQKPDSCNQWRPPASLPF